MSRPPWSRVRAAVLAGGLTVGVLVGTAACGSAQSEGRPASPSRSPKKLTAFEESQTRLVELALKNPGDGAFSDEKRLGPEVGAGRRGMLQGVYDTDLHRGQSVKVDLACTGRGSVALAVVSGEKRSKTRRASCTDDAPRPVPYVFPVEDGRVQVTATPQSVKGAVGFTVQAVPEDAETVEDDLRADEARAFLPDEESEGINLGLASGSLREGIPGSIVDVKKGQRIRVLAACLGTRSMTISGVSGKAEASERIRCSREVGTGSFELTAEATTLRVELRRDSGATGGAAYTIRSP
ncbi:hypothetical protein [Streptomyces sp. NPDC047108]|uniref:hypothetical protein n=1 Tax=Streptomyces sp. NPDC047108 TaxID=3155025 RepID=UPI0033D1839A